MVPPALLPFSILPAVVVDRLPRRWWAMGNLFHLRPTQIAVHFCVGMSRPGVRTIEIAGRTVAWGRAPFDYEASRQDAAWFDQRFERKFGLSDGEE